MEWWERCTVKKVCNGDETSLFFVVADNTEIKIKRIPGYITGNMVGSEDLFPYKTICYKCYRQLVEDFGRKNRL